MTESVLYVVSKNWLENSGCHPNTNVLVWGRRNDWSKPMFTFKTFNMLTGSYCVYCAALEAIGDEPGFWDVCDAVESFSYAVDHGMVL